MESPVCCSQKLQVALGLVCSCVQGRPGAAVLTDCLCPGAGRPLGVFLKLLSLATERTAESGSRAGYGPLGALWGGEGVGEGWSLITCVPPCPWRTGERGRPGSSCSEGQRAAGTPGRALRWMWAGWNCGATFCSVGWWVVRAEQGGRRKGEGARSHWPCRKQWERKLPFEPQAPGPVS